MDIFLVILIIIMLISAYDLRVPEPPPPPDWFQVHLGWSIDKTTVILIGGWLFLFALVFIVGRITGWSRGLWFDPDPDNDMSENERVTGSMMKIGIIVLVIAFVISLFGM